MPKPNTANLIAFDRASARRIDDDGRMHVAQSNISKAVINPYYGSEIPRFVELGLDPQKVYHLLRDPVELERAADSFNNLPLMLKHVHQKAGDPQTDIIVGSISDASYEHPYLRASMCIWDERGIAAVETKTMVELSSSYHYEAVMESGEFEGKSYDGRMTNIRGNHLALVESGRAGPDVVVADANPFTNKQEAPVMKKTKLGIALLAALSGVAPKLAQDSALAAQVGGAKKKGFKREDVVAAIVAMDSDVDTEQLDNIIDAVLDVEQDPVPQDLTATATDNDPSTDPKHAEIIDFLRGKGLSPEDLEAVGAMLSAKESATDEEPEGFMKEEDVKTAMDSMRTDLTKQFREMDAAKAAVRPVVGDVIAMDSAAQVYRFALDHMKIEHKDTPDAGLANLFKVANGRKVEQPPVSLASDAAIAATIKGLDRFS
jgi:hypothetical protein